MCGTVKAVLFLAVLEWFTNIFILILELCSRHRLTWSWYSRDYINRKIGDKEEAFGKGRIESGSRFGFVF